MSIPAGWYPEPGNPGSLRWWDGSAWTTHVRSPEHPTSGGVPSPRAAQPSAVGDIASLRAELANLRRELVETQEAVALQEVGIYQYAHPLENAIAYKDRLESTERSVQAMIKSGKAVVGTKKWTINGSQHEGARLVSNLSKLLLRAYNMEADNTVRTLKPHRLSSAITRMNKARATIQNLGSAMHIEITEDYHRIRLEELELTADYLAKKEEEREREREERARMREEELARRDYERERERLDKERAHYEAAAAALRANGDEAGLARISAKLTEIDAAITGIDSRAANTRAGYVYCISNLGAFGPGVVKIGLTRRLDPLDRVRELGDASVPFRFDVHAMIFSDDAVGLETLLHQRFAARRVNMVNAHREFFYVTPSEVRAALSEVHGSLITFSETPEALEWRQSEHTRGRAV